MLNPMTLSTPRPDLLALREDFNREGIMVCFNGPISSSLIEEIGKALKRHLEVLSELPSAVSDVFAVYVELTQNIRHYDQLRETPGQDTSTILVSRNDEGRYAVCAGNLVSDADGQRVMARLQELAGMSKEELKAAYKAQLRRPREELSGSAGLGLIDMARKASCPLEGVLSPLGNGISFLSLRVNL